jgi:hypothetical protein
LEGRIFGLMIVLRGRLGERICWGGLACRRIGLEILMLRRLRLGMGM